VGAVKKGILMLRCALRAWSWSCALPLERVRVGRRDGMRAGDDGCD
jgi:hypothetical protein